jgi:hypothetical protein
LSRHHPEKLVNFRSASTSGFTAAGLVGGETDRVLAGISSVRTEKNAGTYVTTASGSAANYNLAFVDGTMVINKAPLTVRPNDDARFVIQADTPGYAGASYTGWVGGESPAVLRGSLTVTRSSSGPDQNPGGSNALAGIYTGALTASGLASDNYAITYVPGNYTIVPAEQLLIRVANASALYGSTPTYSVQSAQYLKGSTNTIVDLTANASLTGNAFSLNDGAGGLTALTLGVSSPVLSGAGQLRAGGYQLATKQISSTSSNYSNTVTLTGSLKVTPAPLNLTFSAAGKVYDGYTSVSVSATDTRLSGDAVRVSAVGNFADKNAGVNKSVSVSGVSLEGSDAVNYTIGSTGASPTASITRLPQVDWVGGSSGNWFDPANWAGGAVPDLDNVAAVNIPAGVTVYKGSSTILVTDPTRYGLDSPGAVVRAPILKVPQAPYQVTVMQAPDGPRAGLVHIELRSGVGEAWIELPLTVQRWIRAADPAVLAALPEGIELIQLADRLALRVLPERLQSGDLTLRSSQGDLTLRLFKALERPSAGW